MIENIVALGQWECFIHVLVLVIFVGNYFNRKGLRLLAWQRERKFLADLKNIFPPKASKSSVFFRSLLPLCESANRTKRDVSDIVPSACVRVLQLQWGLLVGEQDLRGLLELTPPLLELLGHNTTTH